MDFGDGPIDLSVVAPAHDERANVGPLVEEIVAALEGGGRRFEIVIVDDASADGTDVALRTLAAREPRLRALRLEGADRAPCGQSAAFRAAFAASRGAVIASLDADLQNDPADLPRMLDLLDESGADLVQGDRSRARRDGFGRRAGSVVGRLARRVLLGDTVRDTGCSLRVMRREVALALPLEFAGMHRFIPVTARQLGYRVVECETAHRPRRSGRAKYGVWNRALPGLVDCVAVRWMRRRRRPASCTPIAAAPATASGPPAPATLHEVAP